MIDTELCEKAAQASGGYSDEEWAALVASADHLDQCTVRNARVCAANILAMPEIAAALKLTVVKPLNLRPSVSTGKRTPV